MSDLYSACSEFFVFNPTLSHSDDEEDNKILFYHPAPTPGSTKHRQIGLCEAIIHFAEPFSNKPLQSIHTEKRAYFLYTPEPNLWFVMVMENPKRDLATVLAAAAAAAGAASSSQPSTANTSTASPQTGPPAPSPVLGSGSGSSLALLQTAQTAVMGDGECVYQEDFWSDECMLVVLSTIYRMFRMFNGPVAQLIGPANDAAGREAACSALRRFLPSIILNIEWARVDLFTTLAGIHFLPVNKNVYLHMQRFVNLTEDTFPVIKYTSVMFRDNLIWSGLAQEDIRVLYKILVSHLYDGASDLPAFFQNVSTRLHNPQIRFVTGGPQEESSVAPLTVYLGTGTQEERHQLVIYKIQDLTCLFVLKGELPNGFYQLLDAHIVRHMSETMLAAIIGEHYQRKTSFDDQYRYIYFNQMNLALKTSLRGKGAELNASTMAILREMHEEFEQSEGADTVCEVLVRTSNDRWIVGRRSEQREFYILFDNSRFANLIEINEEVKKLSSTYFQSIFITE